MLSAMLVTASHTRARWNASAPDMFHTPVTWMPQVHVAVRLGGATALLRWQVLPKMALVDPYVVTPVLVRRVLLHANAGSGRYSRALTALTLAVASEYEEGVVVCRAPHGKLRPLSSVSRPIEAEQETRGGGGYLALALVVLDLAQAEDGRINRYASCAVQQHTSAHS